MNDDRRLYQRLNFSTIVNWEKSQSKDSPKQSGQGVTDNISHGGIRIIIDSTVKVGDILDLDIAISAVQSIKIKGRVVWVDKYQITGAQPVQGYEGGIEFIDVTDSVKAIIDQLIFRTFR